MTVDHFEREIKLSLMDAANYQRLISHLPLPHRAITQTNLFFDTPEREFGKKLWALRVRREVDDTGKEKSTLTLKGPSVLENGVTIRPEYEIELSTDAAEKIISARFLHRSDLGQIEKHLIGVTSESFAAFASFSNSRLISSVSVPTETEESTLQFEVDATTYSDETVDYELEIELSGDKSESRKIFPEVEQLLKRWEITYRPEKRSKLERALLRAGQ